MARRPRLHLRGGAALLMAGLLAACMETVPPAPVPSPPARPARTVAPVAAMPSAASAAMRARLARVEATLLAQGLLRTDGGGTDTPFNDRQLAENFIRIALHDEYVSRNGSFVPQDTPSRLRRWEQPIRMAVEFGAGVPEAQRAADRAEIEAYAARLSRASGHPIRLTDAASANYHILILNEDERRAYGSRLTQIVPGIDPVSLSTIVNLPASTFCVVFAFSSGQSSVYTRAVAVIRAEHPDRMRLSCIHEEVAQGMGLANDSPSARPSIFNDDEEFALLTRHDELLLKMLYDKRLRPGMTPEEARPIVERMAYELIGGES
ncbi:MAG: DUF2927 domain-containing protein [Defluviimonas sp.]|nr:DUF2927 domain-containing protein [Defluviimonas sp.]